MCYINILYRYIYLYKNPRKFFLYSNSQPVLIESNAAAL